MEQRSYGEDRRVLERGKASGDDLCVLSWNLLADGLAESGGFSRAPAGSLVWASRFPRIVEALTEGDGAGRGADLIALQEVDRFHDLEARLRPLGYAGLWVPKATGRDGPCVFFHRERFALRWSRPLRFVTAEGASATQVAVMAALEDLRNGRPLLVATTHLKAKPGFEAVREHQAQQLLAAVKEALAQLEPGTQLIVTADLNDTPDSAAYKQLVSDGSLTSAYAELLGEEAPWTTWKVRSSGEVRRTIDYIFTGPTLRPEAVLLPPPMEMVDEARLPSERYPSDHLCLWARLRATD